MTRLLRYTLQLTFLACLVGAQPVWAEKGKPTNNPPVAQDDTATVVQGNTVVIPVLKNDSDPDGLTVQNIRRAKGVVRIQDDGTLLYRPTPNFVGEDAFEYTISDGKKGKASALVVVQVLESQVNHAPVAADDAYKVDEDDVLTVAAPGILANDSDPDQDNLTAELVDGPEYGQLILNNDGSFTYTPNAGYNGSDSLAYRAYDGDAYSNTATVLLAVGAVNHAPVAADDAYEVDEDDVLAVAAPAILANDSDPDQDNLTAELVNGPEYGQLTLNDDGSFTYTPAADYYGSDSFAYQAGDEFLKSGVATVAITVNPVPDAPVAVDDYASTAEETPIVIDVLENDIDVDGDEHLLQIVNVTQHNAVVHPRDDGKLDYQPHRNFSGTDVFNYTIIDPDGLKDEGMVTVTVGGVNDAPVAYDTTVTVAEDGSVSVTLRGFDAEGDALTFTLATYPAHGTVQNNQDGTVTYTPDPGFNGTDTFTYTASDGSLSSNTATVTITVNLAEVAESEPIGAEGGSFNADFGDDLVASIVVPPGAVSGTVSIQIGLYDTPPAGATVFGPVFFFGPSGTTFNPPVTITVPYDSTLLPEGFDPEGLVLLIYNESDGIWTEADSSTVDINAQTVSGQTYHFSGFAAGLPLSRAPYSLGLPGISIDEDAQSTVIIENLADYFADPNFGDQIDFDATSLDKGLHALYVTDESALIVDPKPNFNGEVRIVITATDLAGLSTSDTLFLTVVAVNDAPSAFTLLEPANAAVIQVQPSDLGNSLTFAWDDALDPDGDPVRYAFMLTDSVAFYFEYGDTTVNEVRVPYTDILAAIRGQELTSTTFWWTIVAISGQEDMTEASDGPYSLTIDISTLAVADQSQLPQFFALHQNYPNPFNPVTTLQYELPHNSRVLLVIYDMRGREVIRLVNGYVSAGYNKVVWNSSDASGRPVPSGIYFARLITSGYTHIIKMSLIR